MEQEKDIQMAEKEKKGIDIADMIRIEVRSIEIPVSEYKEYVGMKEKLDAVVLYAATKDRYALIDFFKALFAREIMQATKELHINIKEDDE